MNNRYFWPIICALTLLSVAWISLLFGAVNFDSTQVLSWLIRPDDSSGSQIIWQLRLPRVLLAILVGIHFAIAGFLLQAVIKNPIADPSILGINAGASLAIASCLLLLDWLNQSSLVADSMTVQLSWLPFAAFAGAVLAACLVILLSRKHRFDPLKLALNGMALAAILNAVVMWIVVIWGGGRSETALFWLAGSLYARDFSHLMQLLPWTLVGILCIPFVLRPVALMGFSDGTINSLGLNVFRWRLLVMLLALMLAASAIAVAGPVAFIGLITPHLARLLIRQPSLAQTSLCALLGALVTLLADLFCRWWLAPVEVPLGAVTCLIGIPLFLIILHRQHTTNEQFKY